jgi:hypothetical protein
MKAVSCLDAILMRFFIGGFRERDGGGGECIAWKNQPVAVQGSRERRSLLTRRKENGVTITSVIMRTRDPITPSSRVIRNYYERVEAFERQHVFNEMNVRPALPTQLPFKEQAESLSLLGRRR